MRTLVLAQLMTMVAVAACDDVAVDGDVDASVAVDGAAGDARAELGALTASAPSVARIVPDVPQLWDLTRASGRLGVVVGPGEGASVGPITRLSPRHGQGPTVLRRQHRPTDDEQALLGSAVRLYDVDGTTCAATVTALVDVAQVIERDDHGARSARTLWDVARERDGVTLVAELATAGCVAPVLAEDGAQAPRIATAPRPLAGDDAAAVLARLRALPTYATAQREYAAAAYADDPARPDWSQDVEPVVTRFDLGGVTYETAELTRAGGCGDFGASVFAIWRRGADGARLVLDSQAGGPVGYDLVFADADSGLPGFAVASPLAPVTEELEGCGC